MALFHEALVGWLGLNATRLRCRPVLMAKTCNSVTFAFAHVTPLIRCVATAPKGIDVIAMHEGEPWDLLAFFDAGDVVTPSGWYRPTVSVDPVYFPSREMLWQAECFEPLLVWVNETLANARWLAVYQISGRGARWALLHESPPDGAVDQDCLLATYRVHEPVPPLAVRRVSDV